MVGCTLMALVQMSHTWGDGSSLTVVLSSKARYPDQLRDMATTVKQLWSEAVAEVNSPAEPTDLEAEFAEAVDDETAE
jgi:hypothetical protein